MVLVSIFHQRASTGDVDARYMHKSGYNKLNNLIPKAKNRTILRNIPILQIDTFLTKK